MYKLFKNKTIFVTILATALAGCQSSKDDSSQTTPPPQPQAPQIVREGQVVEIKAWEKVTTKILDLQDAIDLTRTTATAAQVTTSCDRNGTVIKETFSLPGNELIKIFRVIPQEILAQDFLQFKVVCAINLKLSPATLTAGTLTTTVTLEDVRSTALSMQVGGAGAVTTSAAALLTSFDLASQTSLRFANSKDTVAQLICQDLNFAAVPFNQVLSLSEFGLQSPQIRDPRPVGIIASRPEQSCRAILISDNQIITIGPNFKLQMSQNDFSVTVQSAPSSGVVSPQEFNDKASTFVNGDKSLEYSVLKLTNTLDGPRRIRISKATFTGELTLVGQDAQGVLGDKEVIPNVVITLLPKSIGRTALASNDRDFWYAAIPPEESILIHVSFKLAKPVTCGPEMNLPIALGLSTEATGLIEELTETNNVLQATPFRLGEATTLSSSDTALASFNKVNKINNPSLICKAAP